MVTDSNLLQFVKLEDLEIYRLANEISKEVWLIYEKLSWQDRKIFGDQWLRAVDSIGANIAEGFGRFHYLDKNKFNYNARGSLLEAIHWTVILSERGKIVREKSDFLISRLEKLNVKLNNYINSTKKQVNK